MNGTEYTYTHLSETAKIHFAKYAKFDMHTNCFDDNADLIKCNNCQGYGFVECSSDTCPSCGFTGGMQDIDIQDILEVQ